MSCEQLRTLLGRFDVGEDGAEPDVIEFVGRLGGVGLIEILSNLSDSEEAACAWIKTVLLRLFVGSEALGRSGVSHK